MRAVDVDAVVAADGLKLVIVVAVGIVRIAEVAVADAIAAVVVVAEK